MSAGAPPLAPLGGLQRSPRPLALFKVSNDGNKNNSAQCYVTSKERGGKWDMMGWKLIESKRTEVRGRERRRTSCTKTIFRLRVCLKSTNY